MCITESLYRNLALLYFSIFFFKFSENSKGVKGTHLGRILWKEAALEMGYSY